MRESQPSEQGKKAKSIPSRGTVYVRAQSLNPCHLCSVCPSFWAPKTYTIKEEQLTLKNEDQAKEFMESLIDLAKECQFYLKGNGNCWKFQ